MNIFMVLSAIPMVTKALGSLVDIIDSAKSDDPAEPLAPITPLDFEADKKLKESLQALDAAKDILSD